MADGETTVPSEDELHAVDQRAFVIGIGASAGGLEAIRALLKSVPEEVPASYVVVQHVSPTHRSMLASLIDRETHLDVHELSDDTSPRTNHVYVVPPNNDVLYRDGKLALVPPAKEIATPKPSVDRFFKSMAEELEDHAVGIVLSGTGSDGAYGVQAIREAGGITIAQDSATAKYDGMPNSAIETGCVDLVLSPMEIGHRLSSLSNIPQRMAELLQEEREAPPLSEILQVVLARTRVDFRDYKPTTVLRRLERRMLALGIETQEAYAQHCRQNPDEVDALFRDLLISVTRFFRDPNEFLGIRKYIEDLVAHLGDRTLRVWIAGCATGEEAYSIAILLSEALGNLMTLAPNKLQIFATDIDENALKIARAGRYPLGALGDIPDEYLEKYFVVDDVSATVRQDLKNLIIFSMHNVFQDPPFLHIDLICCRNLLIYFGPLLQTRTFSNFHYSLKPRGALFLGTADSSSATPDLFSKAEYDAHLLIKRGTSNFDHRARSRHVSLMVPDNRGSVQKESDQQSLRPSANVNALVKAMVKSLGGDAVLMSRDLNIIRIFGDLTRYISLTEGDAPQLNHMILIEPLAQEIRVLTTLAAKEGEPKSGILRHLERDPGHAVRMSAYPLTHEDLIEDMFLVTLRRTAELPEQLPEAANEVTANRDALQIIDELRRELADAQAALAHSVEEWESANEELKTTNEELQSGSEELQSVNEELETSNEELQSTNEELVTVNEALHVATGELTETNEELNAILSQIELPLLILDKDLNISKASAPAVRIFNITHPGMHPHVSQIPLPPGFPMIAEAAKRVVMSGTPEVSNFVSDGSPYTMTCSAFVNEKDGIGGVTLVFATSQAARELQRLMDQIPAYLMHRKSDGTILRISRKAALAVGCSVNSMVGRKIQEFVVGSGAEKLTRDDRAFLESGRDEETIHRTLVSALNGREISVVSERYRFADPSCTEDTIYSVSIDVSELVETERHLSRTNAELQLILHHAPFFVLNRDVHGKVLLINKGFAEALGTTVEEATGKNVRELFSAEDAQTLIEDDLALLSGQVQPGRKQVSLNLGGPVPSVFHVSRKILKDAAPDGSSTICSVATDIGDAKQFRGVKALTVRDLEAAIGQSHVSIMRLSKTGIVTDINDRGASRLGSARTAVIGKPLDAFLTKDVADAMTQRASRFLMNTESSIEFLEEIRLQASPEDSAQVMHHWIRVQGETMGADEIFSIARYFEGGA
ncbi:MAG: chemotaxis protein CheB [Pseudomonadota bacterium]